VTEVPKCEEMTNKVCKEISLAKGLRITGIRNNSTAESIVKIEKQNKSVRLPFGWKEKDKAINKTEWSNRFLPSFYSPKKFKFVTIFNGETDESNKINIIRKIKHLSNITGLLEYNECPAYINETVITGFWWKFDNLTFLIREQIGKPRKTLIYELRFTTRCYLLFRIVSCS